MRNLDVAESAWGSALLIADGSVVIDRPEEIVLRAARPQVAAQVAPGHELEEQTHRTSNGANSEQFYNVGMVEFRQNGGFPFEVFDQVFGGFVLQHLDGDHREFFVLYQARSLCLKDKNNLNWISRLPIILLYLKDILIDKINSLEIWNELLEKLFRKLLVRCLSGRWCRSWETREIPIEDWVELRSDGKTCSQEVCSSRWPHPSKQNKNVN